MRYLFKYRAQQGFTLLELIVVLVILGIAMAIGTVSLQRAHQKGILKDETLRVQGALRQARDVALIDRMPVTFVANADSDSYWLEKESGMYRESRKVPSGLEIEGEPISFMPKGNSTGGFITIRKSQENRGYVVEVDPVTGTAKVRRL